MSLLLQDERIIDRTRESGLIQRQIQEGFSTELSQALVVWADSGYGKSALIKKVQAMPELPGRIVIVETPPANTNVAPIDGQYLNYIAAALNTELSPQYTLEHFLYSEDSTYQTLIDTDTLLGAAHTLPTAVAAAVGQRALAELSADRLLYRTDTDSILVLKDYIRSAVTRHKIILDITNAQNIDATSFRVLREIMQEPSFKFVIYEYTSENGDPTPIAAFSTKLGCPYSLLEVDTLPLEFVLTILGVPLSSGNIVKIEHFYNTIVRGNLYKIVQKKMDAEFGADAYTEDPILKKIGKLGFSSKLLLAIICLHDGEMEYETFLCVVRYIQKAMLIHPQSEEELKTLIYISNDQIRLRHASIADSMDGSTDNAAFLAAYHHLINYYQGVCSADTEEAAKKNAVVSLIKLHSRFEPKAMIPLLKQFKAILIDSLSESSAFTLIKKAFLALNGQKETYYHLVLIHLCYESGIYSGALELLKMLEPLYSDAGNVLKCMLLNRNDYHDEAVEQCTTLLKNVSEERYKLVLQLIKMLSERSLNLTGKYMATYRKIQSNKKYEHYLEYGFFLRNTQIVLSYRDSLPYLRRSITFFEARGETRYAAYSKLTYLIQKARLGELEESKAQLSELSNALLNSTFEKHICYVNQAAIYLLENKADETVTRLLEKAMLTVTTVFDRIVILNNILCSLIITKGSEEEFKRLQDRILQELTEEPDRVLKRRSYTNFYLYHKHVSHDAVRTQEWMEKARRIKIKKNSQSLEDVFLNGAIPDESMRFLATRSFCVSFITYWHFDIPILGF